MTWVLQAAEEIRRSELDENLSSGTPMMPSAVRRKFSCFSIKCVKDIARGKIVEVAARMVDQLSNDATSVSQNSVMSGARSSAKRLALQS
jgi:hypothetical protein